jgi:FAD/FMN-containing dehydrogenase
MTSHRILQINAVATAACAVGLLAGRGALAPLFGLDGPLLLDVLAIGLLGYAGALALAAHRRPVNRQTLMAFTIADAAWVAGSAVVLLLFWSELAPAARALVIGVALVVEGFATLQFRAAGRVAAQSPQVV